MKCETKFRFFILIHSTIFKYELVKKLGSYFLYFIHMNTSLFSFFQFPPSLVRSILFQIHPGYIPLLFYRIFPPPGNLCSVSRGVYHVGEQEASNFLSGGNKSFPLSVPASQHISFSCFGAKRAQTKWGGGVVLL
jgi:hypothetical protein